MLLIPAALIVGAILALVLYLEKTSPPYQPFDAFQDEFYRAFATHQLIDACMVAGEEPLARALLVSVRDGVIRDQVYKSNPSLASPRASTHAYANNAPNGSHSGPSTAV